MSNILERPFDAYSLFKAFCCWKCDKHSPQFFFTSIIRLVRELRAMTVLATFQNDPWKFTDVRALTVIFRVRSCKMRTKIAIFFPIVKKTEFVLINIFSPTFVPNLVTLAWKMRPGMPKESGSLNGPLCAYSVRQNLHNRTRPRS